MKYYLYGLIAIATYILIIDVIKFVIYLIKKLKK
jgi:hypothetical protein